MGRSANSRNRIFVKTEDGIRTEAHDPAKLDGSQPHHLSSRPDHGRRAGGHQRRPDGHHLSHATATLPQGPDAPGNTSRTSPNWTPRISAILNADGSFELSILRAQGNGRCLREFFCYEGCDENQGYFISTYQGDGNPLPTFAGEP